MISINQSQDQQSRGLSKGAILEAIQKTCKQQNLPVSKQRFFSFVRPISASSQQGAVAPLTIISKSKPTAEPLKGASYAMNIVERKAKASRPPSGRVRLDIESSKVKTRTMGQFNTKESIPEEETPLAAKTHGNNFFKSTTIAPYSTAGDNSSDAVHQRRIHTATLQREMTGNPGSRHVIGSHQFY